jgi:hypothetical protein
MKKDRFQRSISRCTEAIKLISTCSGFTPRNPSLSRIVCRTPEKVNNFFPIFSMNLRTSNRSLAWILNSWNCAPDRRENCPEIRKLLGDATLSSVRTLNIILLEFPVQCRTLDSQNLSRLGFVPTRLVENSEYMLLLEFAQ